MKNCFSFILLLALAGPAFAVPETHDVKLTDYAVARIQDPSKKIISASDEKEYALGDLIKKAVGTEIQLDPKTLRCLGSSSWEGNGKAVGACTIEGADAKSKGEQLKVRLALNIGDDPEHPGASRRWTVVVVSAQVLE